jgi:hypothetical protein
MEKIKSAYKTIKQSFFEESFTKDKDFDKILRLHWVDGILGKENEKKWKSLVACAILHGSVLIGAIIALKQSYDEHKMILNPIFPLILCIRKIMIILELVAFVMKRNELYAFIRKTIEVKKKMRVNSDFNTNKKKLLLYHTKAIIVITVTMLIVVIFKTFKVSNDKCVILLNLEIQRPPNNALHYTLLIINLIHIVYMRCSLLFQDIFSNLAISKLEEIFYDLTLKAKMVTNHRNPKVNSKKLDEFISLHVEALKALKLYHKVFYISLCLRTFFMMTIIAAAFLNAVSFNYFYKSYNLLNTFLKFQHQGNNLKLLESAIICFATSNLTSMICIFGQKLSTQSSILRDEIYNCKWYEQNRSFKKKMIIIQSMMNRDVKLKTIKFTMNRENLYQVIKLMDFSKTQNFNFQLIL